MASGGVRAEAPAEAAIRTVVADQAAAWDAGDAPGYARHVAPDGIVRTQLMEVFVRRDGRWWIEACHNVDVKPRN